MHNIKDIRNNFEDFKNSIKHRNIDINLDEIVELDKKNRNFIHDKEKLEMENKSISKSKDESLFKKSKEISIQIEELSKKQKIVKDKLDNILSSIPNVPLNDVPVGKDENDNKEVIKVGKINKFYFKPKSHYELCEMVNILYFDLG